MHLEQANIPDHEPKKLELPDAPFLSYQPDLARLKNVWKDFGTFQNYLIIGHGGSINSFLGMINCFDSAKDFHFLATTDPQEVLKLKRKLKKNESLVLAISKSGDNITQLEALIHFIDYPILAITQKDSTLDRICKKINAKVFIHPPIGGRYGAFTEAALIPATLAGIDVEGILKGARRFYETYHQDNIALKAAQSVYALEEKGIVDVFMPIYSHELFAFGNLIVQLCHESFGKQGKGQTYFAHESPESQHHTNQRFFGGRRNIAGFFITVDQYHRDEQTIVPTGLHGIPLKDSSLFELHKIPLSYSMQAEFKGTWEDAKIKSIPGLALHLNAITPQEIGSFIAFWQLYAVYSSVLRDVNPFDQPEVESSKLISWTKRKEFKRG